MATQYQIAAKKFNGTVIAIQTPDFVYLQIIDGDMVFSPAYLENKHSLHDYRLNFVSLEVAKKYALLTGYNFKNQNGEVEKRKTVNHETHFLIVDLEKKIKANPFIENVRVFKI
jgi:hypothetical protein